MSPLPRTVLILGLLAATVSMAQAGNEPHMPVWPDDPKPTGQSATVEPTASPAATAPAVVAPKSRQALRAARREERRQAAMQRHAARLALKTPAANAAVATASPAEMGSVSPAGTEKPAPAPGTQNSALPHDQTVSPTLDDLVAKHAIANGVPVKLAQAVVKIESRGNVHASNRGALGLMQIKYGTARAAGFSGAAAGLLVAETNLRYGMKVLADAYRSAGGDVCGALMRYQSGHLSTHMTRSNRVYCSKARAIMAGA